MKKVFGIAAMLLALAACNKIETNVQPVENNEGIPFSATISVGNNATTKALAESGSTIVATWAVDETVALIHNGVKDEMTVSAVNEGVATITGTITGSPSDGDAVTVIYPASAADGTTGNIKADLLYDQNGLLTGVGSIAANYDARKGTGTLKVNGTTASLNGNMTLDNQFAIFKFTVKNADASATIDVKPLIITIGTQDYTVTPASATSELYVALPAVSSQTVSFSATGSDSKIYTCSKDGVTFAAAKYYQSTLKMAEAEPLLLTTITATGNEQASYSTANVATISFSYTAGGSSAYFANWGWWGYGWSATVTAAEGYTITKCIFYDDANRTATDSEAPFVVETTEEDKTPQVNGTPIQAWTSKGIKKIEVYGYATPTA